MDDSTAGASGPAFDGTESPKLGLPLDFTFDEFSASGVYLGVDRTVIPEVADELSVSSWPPVPNAPPWDVFYSDLARFFALPLSSAATGLGLSESELTSLLVRNGVPRWPNNDIDSLTLRIEKLRELSADDPALKVALFHDERLLEAIHRRPKSLVAFLNSADPILVPTPAPDHSISTSATGRAASPKSPSTRQGTERASAANHPAVVMKKQAFPITFPLDSIKHMFESSLKLAVLELGTSEYGLRHHLEHYGVPRWPCMDIRAIRTRINDISQSLRAKQLSLEEDKMLRLRRQLWMLRHRIADIYADPRGTLGRTRAGTVDITRDCAVVSEQPFIPTVESLADLSLLFELPVECALLELGVPYPALQHLCERFGVPRWPNADIARIDEEIEKRKKELQDNPKTRDLTRNALAELRIARAVIFASPSTALGPPKRATNVPQQEL